jgi:hypothetical protein
MSSSVPCQSWLRKEVSAASTTNGQFIIDTTLAAASA